MVDGQRVSADMGEGKSVAMTERIGSSGCQECTQQGLWWGEVVRREEVVSAQSARLDRQERLSLGRGF
jgi:hypothetical protein